MNIEAVEQESKKDDEVIDVPIKDRNGKPYTTPTGPTVWQCVGQYSAAYRKAQREVDDKYQRREITSPEERELFAAERVACGVVGWKNVYGGTEPAKFSREGAARILVKAPWVMKQLILPINEHAGFFAPGSQSS